MTYAEKLKHPKWQKMRLEVLQRDKFTCQLCGDKETELHIHHKEYRKQWTDPWEYSAGEMLCLCKHCHFVVEDLELNMNLDYPSVYKRINPHNVLLVITYSVGVWIYEGGKPNMIKTAGFKHKVASGIVQTIMNYWLRTENEHLLVESTPDKTNNNG